MDRYFINGREVGAIFFSQEFEVEIEKEVLKSSALPELRNFEKYIFFQNKSGKLKDFGEIKINGILFSFKKENGR